jgi:uncharacterized 2Fe-2S/4Fe-4S cluster protein (DUF4445 family)
MSKYAIALDIGTTNISGALIDVAAQKILASLEVPNQQMVYGDDVITRLKMASSPEGMEQLHAKLIDSLDTVTDLLVTHAALQKHRVTTIVAVGNVAMYHLALRLPVATLARAPFVPVSTEEVRMKATALGIKDFPDAEFHFLPNIGGFVGSDALAVIMATALHRSNDVKLAVDLGTNGEVILGNDQRIFVASTAAGPAFEGWHINCGMRPAPGAIISFDLKDDVPMVTTMNDATPSGIASSGLIAVVSALVRNRYLDGSGRLKQESFTLYSGKGKTIYINQDDIREIQLAKSAIHTAITLLQNVCGMSSSALKEVIITGKFGGSLQKEDLFTIGMVPPELKDCRFVFTENLALKGVSLMVVEDRLKELRDISPMIQHVELHKQTNFQEEFAKGLIFGPAD